MIICRTPVRASFGGGGTDIPNYYERFGGIVVSTTINKHFYSIFYPRKDDVIQVISRDLNITESCKVSELESFDAKLAVPFAVLKHFKWNKGCDLFLASELPPSSGLGGSSSLCVNLVTLFSYLKEINLGKKELAEEAHSIRINELGLPAGKQDEYAAAFGGLNQIEFSKEAVKVQPLLLSEEVRKRLESSIMLFHTNIKGGSTGILREIGQEAKKEESSKTEALHQIKELGLRMKESFEHGNLAEFGKLLHSSWLAKKQYATGVSNPLIDDAYETAIKEGALGGKITGAGGRGFLMLYCEPEKQEKVRQSLIEKGLAPLDFKFEGEGTKILIDTEKNA